MGPEGFWLDTGLLEEAAELDEGVLLDAGLLEAVLDWPKELVLELTALLGAAVELIWLEEPCELEARLDVCPDEPDIALEGSSGEATA